MNRMMISAFAICLAAAAPTVLWAQAAGQPQRGQPVHHATPSKAPTGGSQGVTHRVGTSSTVHWTTHKTTTHKIFTRTTAYHHRTTITHAAVYHRHTTITHATTYHRHVITSTVTKTRIIERSHVKVDIATYRRNITAERRFHYGDYRAPAGYAYRRWTYGERLPGEYYARDYWILNYLNFGLPWAPDGYVWVRYGSDAILIDENTGEIVQVDYGVFY